MKYSSIHIAHFRSITDLKVENFKQVNLITGRNNCGKTTVLEALFQVSGMSNPQLPATIHNIRSLPLTTDVNFNVMFHDLDFSQEPPHISATLDGDRRTLTIKPKYVQYEEIVNSTANLNLDTKITTNTDIVPVVNGLTFEYGIKDKKFASEISLADGSMKIDSRYKEKLRCSFHVPQLFMTMLPQRIEKLLINKQMGDVIRALQEIDSRITDIRLGASGILYIDIGLDNLLPINIMGDGIRRILSTLAAVSDTQGGVLLIDEIENGLHYTALKILWKALLKALETYHVQLFATTHSNECIGALASIIDKEEEYDNICLYRIERQENRHQVFEYPSEMILAGIDGHIEMR